MKKSALIFATALVCASGAALATEQVLDIHNPEEGYLVERQAVEAQGPTAPWFVPSEGGYGELEWSEFAAMETGRVSQFDGIPHSNEE